MKISYNWLKMLINIDDVPLQKISEALTGCGLEVESMEAFESVKGSLKGVVVGHVVEKEKHPNADKLSLTKVDAGSGALLSIVCGAPNVEAGQKVLVATVGSILHTTSGETIEIKKSKIRGEASEGMICAEDELGIGKSHAGIMVLPDSAVIGTPAAEYLGIYTDTAFEIGLTPNRGDAASHLGTARDLAAVLNSENNSDTYKVSLPGLRELPASSGISKIEVKVEDKEACPRYSGLAISGVTVASSPQWLKDKLAAIGIRSINNIVDITNFVLHETGQPMHAFDAHKIKGDKVIIRKAKEGEKFTTLDGVERTLKNSDLLIANETEGMCIAGVFGGLNSGVTESTTAIFLEAAYFDASSVRRTAKHLELKTDSSFRFERGADPEMTVNALKRAANLILEIAGGQLSSDIIDIYPAKIEPYKVAFSYANCDNLTGKQIDRNIIKTIIRSVGIEIVTEGKDGLLLHVPRYKYDVSREADVIEEVLRIYGPDKVEMSGKLSFSISNVSTPVSNKVDEEIAALLAMQGFSEAMNTSLTKSAYTEKDENVVAMLNPLSSDLAVLRPTLLYGLLETTAYNINRKNSDLKIFEFGKTYQKLENKGFPYTEQKQLALLISGKANETNHHAKAKDSSFYLLKGYIENIFGRLGIEAKTAGISTNRLGNGLQYQFKKKTLAVLGNIDKKLLKSFDVAQEVFYAEIYLEEIYALAFKPVQFKEAPKFPAVKRDLALLVDKQTTYAELERLAYESERNFLKDVSLFDVYEGDKLPAGKKSYAISFTLQNEEATLTDKQISAGMEKIAKSFAEKLNVTVRQ